MPMLVYRSAVVDPAQAQPQPPVIKFVRVPVVMASFGCRVSLRSIYGFYECGVGEACKRTPDSGYEKSESCLFTRFGGAVLADVGAAVVWTAANGTGPASTQVMVNTRVTSWASMMKGKGDV